MSSVRRASLRWVVILAMLGLAACRTVVPNPTGPVDMRSHVAVHETMHQIGPQRVRGSMAVRFADLGRGHLDLLIGGWGKNDGFRVEWGDGHGHWTAEAGPPTRMKPRFIATGDVDRDGRPDILIGGEGDQKGLQIWSMDAHGAWHQLASPTHTGTFYDAQLVDVNEDGWPDIVAARQGGPHSGGIDVWLNDGHGGWFASVGPKTTGQYTGVAVADVNGDGHVDIVASRRGGMGSVKGKDGWRQVGGVEVWRGDGTGRWSLESLPTGGDAESVAVADVDGDGRLDIVAGMYQMGIRIWFGTKSGWAKYDVTDRGTWRSVRIGALQDNGERDIVAASADGQGIGIWTWLKHGSLTHRRFAAVRGLVPASGHYTNVDLGDVFGRGSLDIAAVRDDGAVEVWSDLRAGPTPLADVRGEQVGQSQSVFFAPGSAHLDAEGKAELQSWLESLPTFNDAMMFRLQGRADGRQVHSELFPNAAALSRSRAEAVGAWLQAKGIRPNQIRTVAEAGPQPPGMQAGTLQDGQGRVAISAFDTSRVRMLPEVQGTPHRDLFHVSENAVFKTVHGVPEYRVGPGDNLAITFWTEGKPDINQVTVQDDGTVSLPDLPSVKVEGLTPTEIKGALLTMLRPYVRHPRADVVVTKALSKSVTIFGEVGASGHGRGPGIYHLSGKESLVHFLSRTGGPTKEADLSKVQLVRDGHTIVLDLERAIRHGDWSENVILDDGDTIFVPSLAQSKQRVYVLGDVKKPGIVEYSGDISFLDAIEKSGGFNATAYLRDIRIIRQDRDHPDIVPVAFNRFMQKGDLTQNVALQDKDVIIVPASAIGNWNSYIKDIMPTVQLLEQPLNAYSRWLSVKELQRVLKGSSSSTTAVTVP